MSLQQDLQFFAPLSVPIADGQLQFRQAGRGSSVTHVLLHGIGSGSASWVRQLQAADLRDDLRVLAWEAPGYGASTPVKAYSPQAKDYAYRLWDGLDQLGAGDAPLVLVGHSLGALMAAAAARQRPEQISRLVLLAPARGYGDATPALREEKLKSRLDLLQRLGPAGMAQARSSAMLSAQADENLKALVAHTMSQVHVVGYTQAAHLLSNGVLLEDLQTLPMELVVASGEADVITQPQDVQALAQRLGLTWQSLGPVGHACPLEAAAAVNALLGLTAPIH